MNEIFLSYRRGDARGTTGRHFDHLAQAFGKEAIFYDVDKIPRGVDFREFIDQSIRGCKVVLVVIGPDWLSMRDEKGRRLDQVNDPVRIEIETALRWRKKIIPVLIDDARMPDAADLPATIERLADQNAAPMHNNQYFEQDINTLINDVAGIGVARKTQGFIANPPSAGFLMPRRAAAIVGVPLVSIGVIGLLIAVLVVGSIGYIGYTALTSVNGGAHDALNAFCSAMQSRDYNTAYTYLSPNLKASIGSPSNLPKGLVKDFFGDEVTVVGCRRNDQTPFFDGAYQESGNSANDVVDFDAIKPDGSSETIQYKIVFFVKVGGDWKIDRIQDQ